MNEITLGPQRDKRSKRRLRGQFDGKWGRVDLDNSTSTGLQGTEIMALEPDPKADYKGKVQGMSSRGREKGAKLKMEYRQYGTKFLR
ncbi:hypothetical protein AnigIFM63309_002174 [Aspergillus niger]|nr:hypothetical protein AnigIFM63309_002174 [Aspergillus niger]